MEQTPQPAKTTEVTPEKLGVMMGSDLAERLKKAGIEARGQRRSVTVLFTDLTGYTALSEKMDSEDVYDLVQRYVRVLINNVYKYEGIVDKLTGDGLMALFGAPISLENNAERAVRAALDMQADITNLSREIKRDYGIELKMRVGLHSGMVVVGGVGSNLMMNYTAIGDTVNLAHRIEEAAPPGTILVSEHVYRQIRPVFDCQQSSVLTPKGISRPVVAYRVLGLKSRPGRVRGLEGLRAPMIGRDSELDALKHTLERLIDTRCGQFTLVTGEAGLGKSRLISEFKSIALHYPVRLIEGASLAYRRSVSYWIFQDLLYNYLGVHPNTPALEIRDKLSSQVYQSLGNQGIELLPYLEHILSLPYSDSKAGEKLRYLDAGQLRKQIFLALRDLLLLESRNGPLLVILEDLHWADDASLNLIQYLLESLKDSAIFLLGITRDVLPGAMEKAVEWARTNLEDLTSIVQLQHLSLNQSEELLYQLLSLPEIPDSLREQILQRSAGIPFFLEEILRMLIDEGVLQYEDQRWQFVPGKEIASIGVPTTLQDLILARFDRLDTNQRRVLQVASVIGKDFNLPVLSAVLQLSNPFELRSLLSQLTEREFVLPRPGSREMEYTFRHILMSDAIFGTLLKRERSQLHGQVAAAIERLYAGQLESQIELLANHYRWSPQRDRALHYLILAGEKAARNNVNEQARSHFEAALELLSEVDHTTEQAARIHLGLGDAFLISGDYPSARQQYENGLEVILAEDPAGLPETRSDLYRKIARTYERQGEHEEAFTNLASAQQALESSPKPGLVEKAQILNDLGWLHLRRGDFAEAQQHLERALELVESSEAYDVIAAIYNRLAGLTYYQGDWDKAAGLLRNSIALRESIRDLAGMASSYNNLANLEIELGQFNSALEHLTRSYELHTRLGQAEGVAGALSNIGWLRTLRGELQEAEADLQKALEIIRPIGYTYLVRLILRNLAELYLANGEWDKAQQALAEINRAAAEIRSADQRVDLYRLLGEAALGKGDLDSAVCWAQQADELVASLSNEEDELSTMQSGELRRFKARLAGRQGDWTSAKALLQEGRVIFQKLQSHLYTGRIVNELGALAEAQGDFALAVAHYQEAQEMFAEIGAGLEARRAEEAANRLRAIGD